MHAIEHNSTLELMHPPIGKKFVGCKWVYASKVNATSDVDRLKANLVIKGYTSVYGLNSCDTFSHVAKIKLFIFSLLQMQFTNGLFTSWILKMSFFMMI